MKVIEKDLLTVESGIIAHQVNCQGVMGSGVAALVKEKWPKVFEEYVLQNDFLNALKGTGGALGTAQVNYIGGGGLNALWVANIFGQDRFGSDMRYTRYPAVGSAILELEAAFIDNFHGMPDLYVPYLMGCDRGGGDWEAYSTILTLAWPGEVIACKLPA